VTASELRIGDLILITGVPGEGIPNYYIHRETTRVFKKLVARKRPVRIRRIDEYGAPWYLCKFKKRDGTFEVHDLAVCEGETNWLLVKRRPKKTSRQAKPRKPSV
jgi:hypothetical protein